MDDLLTTRQLQELLQVDRITIYRMLNDGRLHGFKVGGQWRFSRQAIEAWLQEQESHLGVKSTPPPPGGDTTPTLEALPLACIQAIQGVCAEALEIGTVTIDLTGAPLTEVSNSCGFCELILSTEEGKRRCGASWRGLGAGAVHRCHAGVLCTSAPILVSGQEVGLTAGCQFTTQKPLSEDADFIESLRTLATDLGLAEAELRIAAGSVRVVSLDEEKRICRLVQRMTETFSEIGQERLNLLSRLQHIAEMSQV